MCFLSDGLVFFFLLRTFLSGRYCPREMSSTDMTNQAVLSFAPLSATPTVCHSSPLKSQKVPGFRLSVVLAAGEDQGSLHYGSIPPLQGSCSLIFGRVLSPVRLCAHSPGPKGACPLPLQMAGIGTHGDRWLRPCSALPELLYPERGAGAGDAESCPPSPWCWNLAENTESGVGGKEGGI